MSHGIAVGVDAGGSRTVAVAAHAAGKIERFEAGPANATSAGAGPAAAQIAAAVTGALHGEPPGAIYAGVAGAWNALIAEELQDELTARFHPARVGIGNDAEIALRAAVPDGDALLLIAGTGSIAYGEVGGERIRRGGLGAAIGDEGSGYAIGAAGVRLLARAFDGRAPMDETLEAFAARLGANDATELAVAVAGDAGIAAVASLAGITVERAGAGDRTAAKLVQAAALDLFELVRALVRAAHAGERELPLVFAGGLLRENSMLTYLLETRIANEFPRLQPVKNAPEPCFGALAVARRLMETP